MLSRLAACALVLVSACTVGDPTDDDLDDGGDEVDTSVALRPLALRPGANGRYCVASPYNCRFREGSSRVTAADGNDSWAITPGASVRDGDGRVLVAETGTHLTFNFGQTRALAGKAHALALTTSNASAGWYPIDQIVDESAFRAANGEVNAKDPGLARMGCYEIANSDDEAFAAHKVVKGSTDPHERAGDYLPLVRADGKRSANLVFSVPGFSLGGATTDHFLAGTKFRRVEVTTDSGRPSISIPLWDENHPTTRAGSMRFVYGYVRASDGVKRFGWMAQAALVPSSNCP